MDNILFHSYVVEERSYVAFIKREIHNLVKPHFGEQRTGEIDIVISEMTSNLIKHAKKGELLYRLSKEEAQPVFEVICIDSGPGIKDLSHSMKDGISSKSTLGQGIGSITRLSSFSQFYTLPDWGTIVYSKFYVPDYSPPTQKVIVRCLNVAKPGEGVSGDGISIRVLKDRLMILVGDGLGHGAPAKEAVDTAIRSFNESNCGDPSDLIRELNVDVKRTRGLVATITVLMHETKQWLLCGVGNINTRLQKGLEYKNYISNNGIVGLNIPARLENYVLEMEKFQHLILCSDGINTRWDLARYPSILKHDPMILAAVLYKDHSRRNDDMTILVVKTI